MLKQFARNEKNEKRGVMLAFVEGKEVKIGYSFLHPDDKEKMNLDRMEKMAIGRAQTQFRARRIHNNKEELAKFVGRCKRYFKDADMPTWTANLPAIEEISGGTK